VWYVDYTGPIMTFSSFISSFLGGYVPTCISSSASFPSSPLFSTGFAKVGGGIYVSPFGRGGGGGTTPGYTWIV